MNYRVRAVRVKQHEGGARIERSALVGAPNGTNAPPPDGIIWLLHEEGISYWQSWPRPENH